MLGEYINEINIPLEFTVREVELTEEQERLAEYHDVSDRDLLQLSIGDVVIWTEGLARRLYWDRWGDGGPSLEEALMREVIGPMFRRLVSGDDSQ